MTEFKRKSEFEKSRLSLEELSEYYREKRADDFRRGSPLQGIRIRKWTGRLVAGILKLDRVLSRETLRTVRDERIRTSASKIYVCTHIGGKDAERVCEGIQDHGYFLSGDPGQLYREAAGVLLFLKGTIDVELKDPFDRHVSKERCIELLQKGGNLIIYSEGAWNITDSTPVMPLYPGAVEMVLRSKAEIVPVALEQNGKDWLISLGRNIQYEFESKPDKEQIHQLTMDLRDRLASLKWEIWETFFPERISREELDEETAKEFYQNIESKFDHGYTRENVLRDKYHVRNGEDPITAFEWIRRLVPDMKNAFLWRNLLNQYGFVLKN